MKTSIFHEFTRLFHADSSLLAGDRGGLQADFTDGVFLQAAKSSLRAADGKRSNPKAQTPMTNISNFFHKFESFCSQKQYTYYEIILRGGYDGNFNEI